MAGSPTSAESEARIDLVRGASSLHVEMDKATALAPPAAQALNSRQDYVRRRYELWESPASADSNVELGAISRLPLELQVAFRVKMFSIFALQLLFVCALVGACAYAPEAHEELTSAFQSQIAYPVGAGVGVVLLLVLLYFIRALFPLNWLVLLLFSVTQAQLFVSIGIEFDSNLGFFNCVATFSCVVIMLLLSGVRRRAPNEEPKLLSSIAAGFIAYVIVALVATGVYFQYGQELVELNNFGSSLAFQFMLTMWFAVDAVYMYRVMSPDEYMHGVIYFYTDMILLVLICAAVAASIALAHFCCGENGPCKDCCKNNNRSSNRYYRNDPDPCCGDCCVCCVRFCFNFAPGGRGRKRCQTHCSCCCCCKNHRHDGHDQELRPLTSNVDGQLTAYNTAQWEEPRKAGEGVQDLEMQRV